METVRLPKLGARWSEFGEIVGGRSIADRMIKAGWVKPIIRGNRQTLFAVADIERAFDRLRAGEELPPLR